MMDFLRDIAIVTAGVLSIIFWVAVVIVLFIEIADFLVVDPIKKKTESTTETPEEV